MAEKRVLIVDDERNIRLTLGRALEQIEQIHRVDEAGTGESALEMLKNEEYDLVILDIKLPGVDGIAVLRTLREWKRMDKVLMISAHGTVANAVEAMKLGAVDFLEKPFTPDEVRSAVGQSLERHRGFFRRLPPEEAHRASRPHGQDERGGGEREGADRNESGGVSFDECIQQAKAAIELLEFRQAAPWLKRALHIDPSRPEAYNILGVVTEMGGDLLQAQKYYRAAISLDPTYVPAHNNLGRSTGVASSQKMDVGNRVQEKRSPFRKRRDRER